jgi:peptidylprolyl isomerase
MDFIIPNRSTGSSRRLSTLSLLCLTLLLVSCSSGGDTTGTAAKEPIGDTKNSADDKMPAPTRDVMDYADQLGTGPGNDRPAAINLADVPSMIGRDTVVAISGLRYVVVREGDGIVVESGMTVEVDYAGYLSDGTVFDTSVPEVGAANNFDRGGYPFEPISFVAGTGQVIRGWDEALVGMRVGDVRRLIIPSDLAYGSRGIPGTIPPNATLIFDVHLLGATY